MAKTSKLLPVTIRSVLQRAGRKLPEGQQLLRARPGVQGRGVGSFYIVDKTKGAIIDDDDDLTALARRAGLIEGWEVVE
jgi:hypothetical protein